MEEGGLVFLSDEAGEVHAVGNATGTGACAHIWEKGGVPHGVGDAPSDDEVPPRSRVEARDGIDEGQHVLADVEASQVEEEAVGQAVFSADGVAMRLRDGDADCLVDTEVDRAHAGCRDAEVADDVPARGVGVCKDDVGAARTGGHEAVVEAHKGGRGVRRHHQGDQVVDGRDDRYAARHDRRCEVRDVHHRCANLGGEAGETHLFPSDLGQAGWQAGHGWARHGGYGAERVRASGKAFRDRHRHERIVEGLGGGDQVREVLPAPGCRVRQEVRVDGDAVLRRHAVGTDDRHPAAPTATSTISAMLLALDIGNTNVVAGLFAGDEIRAEMRVATDRDRTADEWHVLWDSLLRIRGFGIGNVTGACIASVVPGLIAPFEVWLAEARVPTVTCRSGDDLGVGVDIDNPAEAGIDRVLNCLAAKYRHGAPAIVVDMGTATTFDVLSREGNYIGGAIAPGMGVALDALVGRTSQLRRVPLVRPPSSIGRSTVQALQSGAILGYAGLVEGLVSRLRADLDEAVPAIATGGLAPLIVPETTVFAHIDPDLTLHGIRLAWERLRGIGRAA